MSRTRAPLAAALGLLADRALGEPPAAFHPVAAFGRLMTGAEQALRPGFETDGPAGSHPDQPPAGDRHQPAGEDHGGRSGKDDGRGAGSWRDGRSGGVLYAAGGVGVGMAAGAGLASVGRAAFASPIPAGVLATSIVVAGRALGDEARAIGQRLQAGDLDGARGRLPALVGRDPDSLDAKGVARAVVESVAENTVDAVVAPACWAALAGPAGAGFYRAANTLDAMVGHRNERYERFGWAAARLDDAANWLPARLAGGLVAAVRPRRARDVLDAVVHPPAHPSPNAGVIEAAFAAALGLRLGGDTVYAGLVDPRPAFGSGRPPEPADIAAAVRLSRDVTLALAALLGVPSAAGVLRRTGVPHRGGGAVRNAGWRQRGRPTQPAFVYRRRAERERRFGGGER